MSHQTQQGLQPKLRFPEFRDAGEWEAVELNQIAKPITDKAIADTQQTALTLSGEHGLVHQGEYFGKKIAGEKVERYIKIAKNDFVYNDRTTKLSKYGTIKRLSKHEEGIVSPIYKCFRFKKDENPIFWEWYFESGTHETQLHNLINEGARDGRFNISIQKFLSALAWRPKETEQQKIADCLSSLDELVEAERGKLETLKTYKKGLMQRLFPAEGETVPKLRFPEFRDAGEWEEKILGDLCSMQAGKFIPASEIYGEIKENLYPCYGGNGLRGYVQSYTHTGKHPLIGRQGALCGNINMATGIFYATEHAVVVTAKKDINIGWLYYQLIRLNLNQYATGQAQPGLSVEVLEKVISVTPRDPKEQQRIADCLSSIDNLITAQNQKVDTLKEHKKGLMQQLFPAVNEAQA